MSTISTDAAPPLPTTAPHASLTSSRPPCHFSCRMHRPLLPTLPLLVPHASSVTSLHRLIPPPLHLLPLLPTFLPSFPSTGRRRDERGGRTCRAAAADGGGCRVTARSSGDLSRSSRLASLSSQTDREAIAPSFAPAACAGPVALDQSAESLHRAPPGGALVGRQSVILTVVAVVTAESRALTTERAYRSRRQLEIGRVAFVRCLSCVFSKGLTVCLPP